MTSDLVLVSGASGFLASHIVKQLQEQGYRVRGTVRSLKDEKKVAPLRKLVENPKYPLELCEADLLDEKGWIDAVKDCKYVIHTASPVPNYVPDDENEVYRLYCIAFSCVKILMMILVYKASC
jgi:nucleoside-diphosphate-sugar epimerase